MKSLRCLAFICLVQISFSYGQGQVLETKNWCLSRCDLAGDERTNTELVRLQLQNDSIRQLLLSQEKMKVPLRIAIIQTDTVDVAIPELRIRKAIDQLNNSFSETNLVFYLKKTDVIYSLLKLEDMSDDLYRPYDAFSERYDLPNMISIYIFDHRNAFCQKSATSISCGRTGGFSYILSDKNSNIVMSRFDISDIKILAHEMGHFWGLYHTFEEAQYGKDDFSEDGCLQLGDRICDTPPDPGPLYEIYANYSDCELLNLKDDAGYDYKPLLENNMSYYKPCYLKAYSFTPGQIEIINSASTLPIRQKYIDQN